MSLAKVSVVIVNWNGAAYLGPCLEALVRQERKADEVILVDNGSTDGSPEFVERQFPWVHLVRSERNLGFAAGCNSGVKVANGDYVVTLNSDTKVEPQWLARLVEPAEADPALGMCASLMLFMDRPNVINSAGIAVDVLGVAWDRLGGRPLEEGREAVEVFGPCAGAALYRRSMWDQLGGFDEDFFMYLEDVDLAWRARARGWRCRFVPEARVLHAHSASAVEGSAFKDFYKARNRVWVIAKNYPAPQVWWWLPAILGYDLMAVGYSLARGFLGPLRGRIAALCGLGVALRKRKQAQPANGAWQNVRRCMAEPSLPWDSLRRVSHLRSIAPH